MTLYSIRVIDAGNILKGGRAVTPAAFDIILLI